MSVLRRERVIDNILNSEIDTAAQKVEDIMRVTEEWKAIDRVFHRYELVTPRGYDGDGVPIDQDPDDFQKNIGTWIEGFQAEYYGPQEPFYIKGEVANAHTWTVPALHKFSVPRCSSRGRRLWADSCACEGRPQVD